MTRIQCPSRTVIQGRPPWCVYLMMVFGLSLLPALTWARADLMIGLEAPDNAKAGEDIGASLTLNVINRGDRMAQGTRSSDNGYMIDIFITRQTMPTGYPRYDEHYFDGVLLKGGRVSNCSSICTCSMSTRLRKYSKTGQGHA